MQGQTQDFTTGKGGGGLYPLLDPPLLYQSTFPWNSYNLSVYGPSPILYIASYQGTPHVRVWLQSLRISSFTILQAHMPSSNDSCERVHLLMVASPIRIDTAHKYRFQCCVSQCVVKYVVSFTQCIVNGDFNARQANDCCEMQPLVEMRRNSSPQTVKILFIVQLLSVTTSQSIFSKQIYSYLATNLVALFMGHKTEGERVRAHGLSLSMSMTRLTALHGPILYREKLGLCTEPSVE